MNVTLPQLLLLNHASRVNYERSEERRKAKAEKEDRKKAVEEADPVAADGKRLSELTAEQFAAYVGG